MIGIIEIKIIYKHLKNITFKIQLIKSMILIEKICLFLLI